MITGDDDWCIPHGKWGWIVPFDTAVWCVLREAPTLRYVVRLGRARRSDLIAIADGGINVEFVPEQIVSMPRRNVFTSSEAAEHYAALRVLETM